MPITKARFTLSVVELSIHKTPMMKKEAHWPCNRWWTLKRSCKRRRNKDRSVRDHDQVVVMSIVTLLWVLSDFGPIRTSWNKRHQSSHRQLICPCLALTCSSKQAIRDWKTLCITKSNWLQALWLNSKSMKTIFQTYVSANQTLCTLTLTSN